MSLGILNGRARAPLRGLGGYVSTIPSECWDQAGFKDCNTVQYGMAKAACQAKLQDNDACIGPLADQYTMANCKCTKKTTTTATKPKPVVVSSSAPSTDENPFEPSNTIFGFDQGTVAMAALVGVGIYLFMGSGSGKKKAAAT